MNFRARTVLFFVPILVTTLDAQISAPRAGVVRYGDRSVRVIYGIPAAFRVGEQLIPFANAVSFSDSAGLISRNGEIQLLARDGSVVARYDSIETEPVLNVDGDLNTAIAWLPSTGSLLHWDGRAFQITKLDTAAFSGSIGALRIATPGSARLLIDGTDGSVFDATVSLDDGRLLSWNVLPAIHGPAFLQDSFVIFHDRDRIEIESANGSLRAIPLAASDLGIERMSSNSLHLFSRATNQDWVLYFSKGGASLSRLPVLAEVSK